MTYPFHGISTIYGCYAAKFDTLDLIQVGEFLEMLDLEYKNTRSQQCPVPQAFMFDALAKPDK